MAHFAEALEALEEYRAALLGWQQGEDTRKAVETFSARGAFGAYATPLSNVHATGVGIRLRGGRPVLDDFVLKVYVFDKQDLGKRTPSITGPAFRGVGIDVEYLPVQRALATRKTVKRKPAATTPAQHRQRHRPVVGGVQIAPVSASYVGTLGCFVRRDDRLYALSNNHVLADTNRLPAGTRIAQPTGGDPALAFAALADVEPIRFPEANGPTPRNRMDAAIAAVTDETLVAAGRMFGIAAYRPELIAARPGLEVTKAGRTTGVTRGLVTAIRVNGIAVNYGTQQNPIIGTFDNCVQIGGQGFSAPGDSGSAILDGATGRPLALLFAGDGRSTSACDLTAVCARFNAVPA